MAEFSPSNHKEAEKSSIQTDSDIASSEIASGGGLAHPQLSFRPKIQPTRFNKATILTLQRSIGNQAVVKLLARQKKPLQTSLQRTLTVNGEPGSPFNQITQPKIKELIITFNLKKKEAEKLREWAASSNPDDPKPFASWKEAVDEAREVTLTAQAINKLNTHVKIRDTGKAQEIAGCHDKTEFIKYNAEIDVLKEDKLSEGVWDITYKMKGASNTLTKSVYDPTVWTDDRLVKATVAIVKKAFEAGAEQRYWVDNAEGNVPMMVYLDNIDQISNFHFLVVKLTANEAVPIDEKLQKMLLAIDKPETLVEMNRRKMTKTQQELKNLVTTSKNNPKIASFDDWLEHTFGIIDNPKQLIEHLNELREGDERLGPLTGVGSNKLNLAESKIRDSEGFPVTNQTADLDTPGSQVEVKTVEDPIKAPTEINTLLRAGLLKFEKADTTSGKSYEVVIYASYDPNLFNDKIIANTPNFKKSTKVTTDGRLLTTTKKGNDPAVITPEEYFNPVIGTLNKDVQFKGKDVVGLITVRMENGQPVIFERAGTTWSVKR